MHTIEQLDTVLAIGVAAAQILTSLLYAAALAHLYKQTDSALVLVSLKAGHVSGRGQLLMAAAFVVLGIAFFHNNNAACGYVSTFFSPVWVFAHYSAVRYAIKRIESTH